MIDICPTITAADVRTYHVQLEQVASFARRLHIDIADGQFTPNKLIDLDYVWWPGGIRADIHVMYKDPSPLLPALISLQPQLLIVHAEAEGDFQELASELHSHDIEVGVALLPDTTVNILEPALEHIDHILIFSGKIGYFGGHADLNLLNKVSRLKHLKPQIEIGWDGGVNLTNARKLTSAGVEVLNAGGFIHGAKDPEAAYEQLFNLVNPVGAKPHV